MLKLDDGLNNQKSRLNDYLKNHFNTIIFLIILTVIVSIITVYRIMIQIEMGPVSDSVVFLANALVFAGQGTGYSNLLFPPFFSFIVSFFFRLGYVYPSTIFAVDGGLFVFGVVGLFLLLKLRFNNLESFLGGLLYATFPVVILNLGLGLSDLSSVSFSIWAFYFTILAVKKDSKFFYLGFPFLMLAFLTRYNSALLIFPIFLYILINKDKINFKDMIMGISASILIIIPVLLYFFKIFGNIIYPFISFASSSTIVSVTVKNPYYHPDVLFFLQNFPLFVGAQGFIVLLIVTIGIILYLLLKVVNKINNRKQLFTGLNFKNRVSNIKWITFVILGILFLGSFGKTFYMFSEILFFIISYVFYDLSKSKIKNLDIHIIFFAWFMAVFIFHSIYIIKDVRYFVVMAPPVVYFMILGLHEVSNRIKIKIGNRNLTFPAIAIILASIMIVSAASQIPFILQNNQDNVVFNEQIQSASQWFASYDPNYENQNIYSDLWPNFSWYLKTNVKPVPIFHDNQSYLIGEVDFNFTQQDSNSYNNYLVTNNADYYISIRQGLNLTSYTPIKEFGDLIIYKRNS